jgi:hypothetical protein
VWAIGEDHKPNITGCGFTPPPDTCQIAGGLNAQFVITVHAFISLMSGSHDICVNFLKVTIAPIISANHKTLHLQILSLCFIHKTVKPAHEITYIKQSPVLKGQICSCPVIENFI